MAPNMSGRIGSRLQRAALAASLALGLGAAFLPAPRLAQAEEQDPAARVQVVIKKIHVLDDRDGWGKGAGEFEYDVELRRYSPSCSGPHNWCQDETVKRSYHFSGHTGHVETLTAIIPEPAPVVDGYYIPPQKGIALYPGDKLHVSVWGDESDWGFDDWLGSTSESYSQAENFGIGTHTIHSSGFNIGGGFKVEYEIRRAPLPDLVPVEIRAGNFADNGDDIVCLYVQNVGQFAAGPFTMRLRVDGDTPAGGTLTESGLEAGPVLERCFTTNIATGQHQFTLTVDEQDQLPEMSELNNVRGELATIQRQSPTAGRQGAAPLVGADKATR